MNETVFRKKYSIIANKILIFLCCIFPFVVWPHSVKMPYSRGYSIAFRNAVDIFEFSKFVLLVIVCAIMLYFLFLKKRVLKDQIYLSLPFLVFLLFVLLSSIFALDKGYAFIGQPTKWQGCISYFCYFIVFTFTYNYIQIQNLEKLFYYMLISSSIMGLFSLFNYYMFDLYLFGFRFLYVAKLDAILFGMKNISFNSQMIIAPIGNRISAGAYFSLTFPLSFFMMLYARTRRTVYVATTIMILAALLASQSRTAWIGTFIGIITILLLEYKKISKKLVLLLSIFVISAILVILLLNFNNSKITERIVDFKKQIDMIKKTGDFNTFGSMRFFIYNRAFKSTREHPLLGTGPDCFAYYGIMTPEDYKRYPNWKNTSIVTKAHSEYLEILSTMGIPAFISYMIFLIFIIYNYLKRQNIDDTVIFISFCSFITYLVQATANIGVIPVLPIFFVICACILRFSKTESNKKLEMLAFIKI